MIKPVDRTSEYLEFECGACRTVFHHAIRIYNDAPTQDGSQEYDIRNWSVAGLEIQCPRCFAEKTYKLDIRPEKKRGVM
jgi:phage FluMu protein Com